MAVCNIAIPDITKEYLHMNIAISINSFFFRSAIQNYIL